MLASRQSAQIPLRIESIGRIADDLAIAHDRRIAGEDRRRGQRALAQVEGGDLRFRRGEPQDVFANELRIRGMDATTPARGSAVSF